MSQIALQVGTFGTTLLNIDLIVWIGFIFLITTIILGITRKMSVGIGIIAGIGGFIITYLSSNIYQIIITPMANALWFGSAWTLMAGVGLIFLTLWVIAVATFFFNLWSSGGKIGWA